MVYGVQRLTDCNGANVKTEMTCTNLDLGICFQDLVIQNLILVYMYAAMGNFLKFYLRTMNGSAGSIGFKSWEIKKKKKIT